MLLNGEKNPTYKFLQDTELISTPRKTGKNQPVKKALRKKIFFFKIFTTGLFSFLFLFCFQNRLQKDVNKENQNNCDILAICLQFRNHCTAMQHFLTCLHVCCTLSSLVLNIRLYLVLHSAGSLKLALPHPSLCSRDMKHPKPGTYFWTWFQKYWQREEHGFVHFETSVPFFNIWLASFV